MGIEPTVQIQSVFELPIGNTGVSLVIQYIKRYLVISYIIHKIDQNLANAINSQVNNDNKEGKKGINQLFIY